MCISWDDAYKVFRTVLGTTQCSIAVVDLLLLIILTDYLLINYQALLIICTIKIFTLIPVWTQ